MLVHCPPTVDAMTSVSEPVALNDQLLGTSSDAAEEVTGKTTHRVAEFFAGIGLVRMGLIGAGFDVVWANDIEKSKYDMYMHQFKDANYVVKDVKGIKAADMPSSLSLAWASFPCTDLSLAGGREGLKGVHSGTFWEFTRILHELEDERPRLVALENVNGLATSHGGEDIKAAIRELNVLGYSVDVITLDARRFVPQSRPRLFLIGVNKEVLKEYLSTGSGQAVGVAADGEVLDSEPNPDLRPIWLQRIFEKKNNLTIHRMFLPDPPSVKNHGFSEIVEGVPLGDPEWWDETRTKAFMDQLSPVQEKRLKALTAVSKEPVYRTAYRRTRNGKPAWEIRADDIAGCLRTARGGSSKQAVVRVCLGSEPRVRWMTPLEYARLMGADDYSIDVARNQALFGFGDAVCVPAVQWLGVHYLKPLADFVAEFAQKLEN